MSKHPVVVSSIYTSTVPYSSGASTTRRSAWVKGTLLGSECGTGNKTWIREDRYYGFQYSHLRITFSRSVAVSDMMPHSFGQEVPPKVNHRVMRETRLVTTCMIVWISALQFK